MSEFIRSTSTESPHLPRWTSVPDDRKHPLGPFHQAPAEFGGEWWFVNPFTGSEPWLRLAPPDAIVLPAGFTEAFGPRPTRKTIPDYHEYDQARRKWHGALANFIQLGVPPDITEAEIASVEPIYQEWEMGSVLFYEGRNGWEAIFPNAAIKGYTADDPWTVVHSPHNIISQHQISMLQAGIAPAKIHPWIR